MKKHGFRVFIYKKELRRLIAEKMEVEEKTSG
jgi:hypothetical protein